MTNPVQNHTRVEPPTASENDIEALLGARHWNPFSILGPHPIESGGETLLSIRVVLPGASKVWVLPRGGSEAVPAVKLHPGGFFEAIVGPVALPHQLKRASSEPV